MRKFSNESKIFDFQMLVEDGKGKFKQKDLENMAIGNYSPHLKSRYEFAVKENHKKLEVEKVINQIANDYERPPDMLLKYGQMLIGLAQQS